MNLSMQGLRVFVSVLEHGSLTATGRDLGMTQPAVSNHVRALEERFGVKLLTRGGRLRATPAGVCLADHARGVLAGISALEEHMARHAAPRGKVNSYVKRHLGQGPQSDPEDSKWRYSLMNWGHDPLK
jgi:DNA-binding transcriptional LysR family regulator